jgi:glycogen(starch) synthase
MTEARPIRRILMTADTIGGVWTYAMELAHALSRHQIQIALAVMGAALTSYQRQQCRRIPNLQVYESTYKLEWMEDPWGDIERAGDWLLALERDLAPDVIHLNSYAHGQLPWNEPCVMVGHSCVLSWWSAVRGRTAPRAWDRYRRQVTWGIRAADFVVAPTRAMLSELDRCYGPLRASAVIANARTAARYHPARKEPFVLAAGRIWDEAKNISLLCDAAPEIEWPVLVAGDDTHPNGGRRPMENVTALGHLTEEELAEYYARAGIFCSPARYEPFGLSILEAALSGCALVLGDLPSLRENWGGVAVFVSPDDRESFLFHVRELISSPGRRASLACAAYARARMFTPERMAEAYEAAYRQALQSASPAALIHGV